MSLSPTLTLLDKIIRAAGASLLADFQMLDSLDISIKGPGDFVSQADKKSEEMIVSALLAERPDWGILGEEGTDRIGRDARYRWIIDPLDGTNNFLHGVPHWCVTIALELDGDIIAGMTFDPVANELYHVEKGQGAFLNDRKLRISQRAELMQALVVIDPGYARQDDAQFAAFEKIVPLTERNTAAVRIAGSGALDLAYLAAGRFDIMLHAGGAKSWDIAAGLLMVRECGGMVTDLALQPADHNNHQILVANRDLHPKYAELIGL